MYAAMALHRHRQYSSAVVLAVQVTTDTFVERIIGTAGGVHATCRAEETSRYVRDVYGTPRATACDVGVVSDAHPSDVVEWHSSSSPRVRRRYM